MRIIFAGTPEPALPSLRRLIDSPHHDVVAVLTRPDAAPAGAASPRRRRSRSSPSTPASRCCDPTQPNGAEFVAELRELAPDCCAVVAYGALLRDGLLGVPPLGWINLHFSLLPAWRGAAPVQAAIAAGDAVTGATTFRIEPSLDSGPVFGVVTETVRPTDTAGDLLERLSDSGAMLLETDPGRHRRRFAGRGAAARRRRDASRRRSPSTRRGCAGTCPPTWSTDGSAR